MLYEEMVAKAVLSKVRGCPSAEAEDQMRNAVREWCKETRCIVLPAEVLSSDFSDPIQHTDMYVIDVVDAELAGEPIDVVAMNDPRLANATAECPVIVFADQGDLQMVPTPTTPVTLNLLLAMAPGPDSTEAPDVLWQRFREELVHGALYRLLAQEGETWAKPAKAAFHETKWREAMTRQAALSGRNRLQNAQRLRVTPY